MNRIDTWAMFFAGIVSIKCHPRNDKPPNIIECAHIADAMMFQLEQRRELWAGSDQSSAQ